MWRSRNYNCNDNSTPHIADNFPNTYCKSKWDGAIVYYEIAAIGNRPAIRSKDLTYSMTQNCSKPCGSNCNEATLFNTLNTNDNISKCTFPNNLTSIHRLESNLYMDFDTDINIYPNPSNSILHISHKENIELNNIQLFTIYGQKILEGRNDLDISNISKGVYTAFIFTNQRLFQKQFIIN